MWGKKMSNLSENKNVLLYICSKAAQPAAPAFPCYNVFFPQGIIWQFFIKYCHTYMDLWTHSTAIIWLANLYENTRNTSLHTFDYFDEHGWAKLTTVIHSHFSSTKDVYIAIVFLHTYVHKVKHKGKSFFLHTCKVSPTHSHTLAQWNNWIRGLKPRAHRDVQQY